MERWASSGAYPQVAFCCINIDEREGPGVGLRICKEFGGSYNLSTVVNGYVKDMSDMPRFGQLGCQGFIFADPTGRVIHPSTPALMQFREQAFHWIEHMLKEYFRPAAAEKAVPIDSIPVVLKGLVSRPELNGQRGYLAHKANESGRFVVRLSGGEMVSVKPSNFEEIHDEDDDNDSSENGDKREHSACNGGSVSCCAPVASYSSATDSKLNPALRFTTVDSLTGRQVDPVTSELFSVKNPASTGHGDMDEEHAACASALDSLSVLRTREQLQRVRDALAAHFAHEERDQLKLSSVSTGSVAPAGAGPALSGFESHLKDHQSILAEADEQIQRMSNTSCSACSSGDCSCDCANDSCNSAVSTCNKPQQRSCTANEVPFAFIYSLVEHFNYHAEVYDVVYSQP
jgi:hypothetical protein